MIETRRGRVLAGVLPGMPQILEGRWGAGLFALLAWALGVWTLLVRWERVSALPYGSLGEWVALPTLLVAIVAPWLWSVRGGRFRAAAGGEGHWTTTLRAFGRNRLALVGMVAIGLFYLVAVLTPFLAPYDPVHQGDLASQRFLAPNAAHPLGTDQFARDVLSRLLYGARVSLSIGFIAVGISVTLGTLIGAVAGYLGGRADSLIMRFVDMVIAFPRLVLLITIIALFEPSIFLIVAVLGLTQWPYVSRIVRGEVLSLREREFVQAARALGYSRRRVILRHIVPNAMAPVIVAATLGIGNTIVLEAGLSFLGLGIQPPNPSWGSMVENGRDVLLRAWWISTFPGLAIVLTVLSFNLVGDGLRDALDPRQAGRR
jgi:peptide/nickel transport system permease protein